jgi:Mn-dependent DtxR family transcriptional regulator
MAVHPYQLVTAGDLEKFRQRLLLDVSQVLREQLAPMPKRWLKSHEVRKLLKISPGTLHRLKAKGLIPYAQVGGIHLYEYEKIAEVVKKGYGKE